VAPVLLPLSHYYPLLIHGKNDAQSVKLFNISKGIEFNPYSIDLFETLNSTF